jgi:hypothetical protein
MSGYCILGDGSIASYIIFAKENSALKSCNCSI